MWLATCALAAGATPSAAQQPDTLRLQVVTTSGEVPTGAIYTVLGPDDQRVLRSLLPEDGQIWAIVRSAGPFRISLQRMGIANWISEPFDVNAGGDPIRITVPIEAVPVGELRARGEQVCPGTEAEARLAIDLYLALQNQMREVVDWDHRGYRFAVRVVRQRQDGQIALGVSRYETLWYDTTEATVPTPLATLDPVDLAEGGYARHLQGDTFPTYYAPTAEVLLSEGFLTTHCFRLVEPESGGDSLGLGFTPRRGRQVVDVDGVLWVSLADLDLRSLAFSFTGLHRFLDFHDVQQVVDEANARFKRIHVAPSRVNLRTGRYHYGGTVQFSRLDNGMMAVTRWELSVPIVFQKGNVWMGRYDMTPVAVPLTTTMELLAVMPPG